MKRSRQEEAARRFGAIGGMHLANLIAKTPVPEREALVKAAVDALVATTRERVDAIEAKHGGRGRRPADGTRRDGAGPKPEKKVATKKAAVRK